ncbi:hypothetical protein MITS9509_02875 [Synechococcus sp. MIT S9509]|nr:hypothetical protein MITS9509_02875 [Synechococcus sp. MIT S9509]
MSSLSRSFFRLLASVSLFLHHWADPDLPLQITHSEIDLLINEYEMRMYFDRLID